MQDELSKKLDTYTNCELVFLQLKTIDLPDRFEEAIQFTEVTKQGILRALAESDKNLVVL